MRIDSPAKELSLDQTVAQESTTSSVALNETDISPGTAETLSQRADATTPKRPIAKRLGRYLIIEQLGAGGMGEVYTAYDPVLDRRVALKVLHPRVRSSADAGVRLLREAQTLAKISHPNVVSVYDVGQIGDDVFVAMEFVRGQDLRSWWKAEKRSPSELIRKCMDAGRGLSAAHEAGLVHRDFKPENVLVGDDGRVRVIDFGIARVLEDDVDSQRRALETVGELAIDSQGNLTQTGAIVGTPAYMAPEQFNADPATFATDQFAFCIVVYEALTGERPFAGQNFAELAVNVGSGDRIDEKPLPPRVARALRKGLAPQQENRFGSLDEVIASLEASLGRRRRYLIASLIAATIVVVGSLVLWSLSNRNEAIATCQTGDSLQEAWSDTTRSSLLKSFRTANATLANDTFPRISQSLDRYGQQWNDSRRQACLATARGEQSVADRDRRIACLDRRKRELRALTTLLSSADAEVVRHSIQAVSTLSPVADCDNLERLRGNASIPIAIEAALAEVKAEHSASRFSQARKRLTEARKLDTDGLGAGPIHYWSAMLHIATGDFQKARNQGLSAVTLAAANKDRVLEAKSWLVVANASLMADKLDDSRRWLAMADVAIDDAGKPPELTALLALRRARNARSLTRFKEALAGYRTAAVLFEELGGELHPKTIAAHSGAASVLRRLGRTDEARELMQSALTQTRELFGDNHYNVSKRLGTIAALEADAKNYEAALETLETSLRIKKLHVGEEHISIAIGIHNIGWVHMLAGNSTKALEFAEKSLALRERLFATGRVGKGRLYPTHLILARIHLFMGKPSLALSAAEKAMAVVPTRGGETKLSKAESLTCRAFLDLGRLDRARERCQKAIALLEQSEAEETPISEAITLLARVELALGNPEEAESQAREALRRRRALEDDMHVAAETDYILASAIAKQADGDRSEALKLIRRAETAMLAADTGHQLDLPDIRKLKRALENQPAPK